jgi:drug/metabolite transporter (DMT)-like permease
MKHNQVRGIVFPVLTALIWGTSFVAQRTSSAVIEPMTFNATRSLVAFVVLLIGYQAYLAIQKRRAATIDAVTPAPTEDEKKEGRKQLILGSLCTGSALAVAANLQQAGIADTAAGKTAFITALYIVLVPILGLFLKKRVSLTVWISVLIAVGGLYCLCVQENFTIAPSDFLILMCAVAYAVHILIIDHFTQKVNGVALSCGQFLVCAILSGIGMFVFEHPDMSAILQCTWTILYVGVFSSGVAYTLQILAQKDSDPTVVSLLLSLESLFGTISGAILLHEEMSGREYIGCALMLVAIMLSQIPMPNKGKKKIKSEN